MANGYKNMNRVIIY